jgi:hypothetical protein
MNAVFRLLLRLVLLAAGLVFAASLLLVALLFFALWILHAVWARLSGRTVQPFVWRMASRPGFGSVFRPRAGAASEQDGAPSPQPGRRQLPDIEDVEVKPPRE